LYTIRKERGVIKGLNIALWGDLKYGRTIHSLIFALAKFGANILFCPSPGLEVPEHVIHKLVTEYGGEVEKISPDQAVKSSHFLLNAIYTTPSSPHQLAMMPGVDIELELKAGVDALYVTRPQKERFAPKEQALNEQYPVVDKKLLKGKTFSKTMVMHPLPRVDELAYELDADPRSLYFKQAALGVPVRMALIALLLGAKEASVAEEEAAILSYPSYSRDSGIKCPNPKCVSVQATETKYLRPQFKIVSRQPLTLRCVYCEHGFEPPFVATSDWHEGRLSEKKYHPADSRWARDIKEDNLIIFDSAEQAQAHGFKPSRRLAAAGKK
ncbi:MAG: hypothetical protein HYX81_02155, partial [Chloroflexi bacterium]|nr:hypothetical protein [Chloroflexota bacterium]